MNTRLETIINSVNKQVWTGDVKVEDIKFKCTKDGLNRRVEVKFEGDDHYCLIRVFKDRTNELSTSTPTYLMGDQNENEVKMKIMRYLFLRFWVWLKSADSVYKVLINNLGFTTEEALNLLGETFDRQFLAEAYSFTSMLVFYREDLNQNLYKFAMDIDLPDNYIYLYKTYDGLKNTNPIITF